MSLFYRFQCPALYRYAANGQVFTPESVTPEWRSVRKSPGPYAAVS